MNEPQRLVYLDAGIINDIADGKKYPQSAVDDLHAAMREVGAALVISFAHVWDFARGTDEATRLRVSGSLNAFPAVVFLRQDPTSFERENLREYGGRDDWQRDPSELLPRQIEAQLVEDFAAEVLLNPEIVSIAEQVVAVAMQATDADASARTSERQDAGAAPPRGLKVQAFAALTRAEPAADMLAFVRAQFETYPPEKRAEGEAAWPQIEAQINAMWLAIAPLLPQMRQAIEGLPADRIGRLMVNKSGLSAIGFAGANIRGDDARRAEVMAWLSPGLAIVAALAERNAKNIGRTLRYSDRADLEHVKFVPYVDLATVDAANFDVLGKLRAALRCPRAAIVERNPSGGADAAAALGALVSKIRALGAVSPLDDSVEVAQGGTR